MTEKIGCVQHDCAECVAREQRPWVPVATTYKEVTDAMNALFSGDYKQVQMAQHLADAKLYNTPPQRPWVGLTDEELAELSASGLVLWGLWRAIEAKLKEKNT